MTNQKFKTLKNILAIAGLIFIVLFLVDQSFPNANVIDNTLGKFIIYNYSKATFSTDKSDLEKTMVLKKWFSDYNNYRWSMDKLVVVGRLIGAGAITTFYMKTGPCEEVSELFDIMSKSIGLQTRMVFNSGEGHQWNEVLIDKEWKHIDVSGNYNFNDPEMYEREWKKNISVVYVINKENELQNISQKYTKTLNLKIIVFDENKLLIDGKIIIQSLFYPDMNYFAFSGITKDGVFQTNIGDNNYLVTIETSNLLLPFGKSTQKQIELDKDKEIFIYLNKSNMTINNYYLVLFFVLVISVLVFILQKYAFKKFKRKL